MVWERPSSARSIEAVEERREERFWERVRRRAVWCVVAGLGSEVAGVEMMVEVWVGEGEGRCETEYRRVAGSEGEGGGEVWVEMSRWKNSVASVEDIEEAVCGW